MTALIAPATQQFLLETLLWTGALIALVMLLRRPVSRWFGPQAAYALWALPVLRLIMPPVTLPAWMATEWLATGPVAAETTASYTVTMQDVVAPAAVASEATVVDWLAFALAIWAVGTAVFLIHRFRQYFALRRKLLADARPMGEAGSRGSVRLVETPATNAPIAFGVRDKVVALPIGFMALIERTTRDLALEHELAHHRGHDLMVNFLVQPLFAMHWFNPLGWTGWQAMRRDQEAACDARVIAARGAEQRAAYASVIAGFATGPRFALAAPMACPVLGDKSIIHRLRSLTMTDISPRRRYAGRALIAAGLLALPLTATISYANAPGTPSAAVAPGAPLAPPAPPAPPLGFALQAAPEVEIDVETTEDGKREVHIIKVERNGEDGEKKEVHRERRVMFMGEDQKLSPEEREKILAEVRRELDAAEGEIDAAKREMRIAKIEMDNAKHGMTKVSIECKTGDKGAEWRTADGATVTRLCTSDVTANALDGLKQARAQIAKSTEMDAEIRAEVLKALDERIAAWKNRD